MSELLEKAKKYRLEIYESLSNRNTELWNTVYFFTIYLVQ